MLIKDRVKPKVPAVPGGTYPGVCVGVVDLGEQYSEMFKTYSNKIVYVWALPGRLTEVDGKQEEIQLSREFSITTKKGSKFRDFMESWNGRAYTDDEFGEVNPLAQIGKVNFLGVTINETGEYSNVTSIMAVPEGYPVPQSTTAPFVWDMDNWDDAAFAKLPEWVQDKIKKSTQYQKNHASTETIQAPQMPAQMPPQMAPQPVPMPQPVIQQTQVQAAQPVYTVPVQQAPVQPVPQQMQGAQAPQTAPVQTVTQPVYNPAPVQAPQPTAQPAPQNGGVPF